VGIVSVLALPQFGQVIVDCKISFGIKLFGLDLFAVVVVRCRMKPTHHKHAADA
jgi:hypothetical protein